MYSQLECVGAALHAFVLNENIVGECIFQLYIVCVRILNQYYFRSTEQKGGVHIEQHL